MTVAPAREATSPLEQRLADPAVADALASLLDHAELVAVLLEGLDQLVARSEVIGDSVLAGVTEVREAIAGADLPLARDVDVPRIVETTTRLVQSDLLDPAAVDTISLLARGLVRGGDDFVADPVPVTGVLSLGKVLKDPDVRRALSYFATVAKAVGRELDGPAGSRAASGTSAG